MLKTLSATDDMFPACKIKSGISAQLSLVWMLKLTTLNHRTWRFEIILMPRWDESNAISTCPFVYSEAEIESIGFDSAAVRYENQIS